MSDNYTPTTEQVKAKYRTHQGASYRGAKYRAQREAEFDRWLAQERNAAVHAFIREASRHVEDHISITALWHLAPGGKNDA